MSNSLSRRRLLMAGIAALSASQIGVAKNTKGRVVIIGGGFGGASAAMHFRAIAPEISVTLIEASKIYTACPFSNLVIVGERQISEQRFQYKNLRAAGINVIQDRATGIDADTKAISLKTGSSVSYDKLILSPGIDLKWDAIEGYDQAASKIMPHAWKAGSQTLLLKQQLEAMQDGGTVIISVPPAPFRCPPGPYERASLIAHYLKTRKPKSKLFILDAQDKFSKKPLFEDAWQSNYPGIIERIPGSDSGRVMRVDTKTRTLHTDFDTFKGDVINIIPPQSAGSIALVSGVTDTSGWCPINAVNFESSLAPDIHIIGDATIAAPMPKSAFSANLQGKICAAQITRYFSGLDPVATTLTNTCYSLSTPDQGFSVSGVYTSRNGEFSPIPGAGGTSPVGNFADLRVKESLHAKDWFNTITKEAFG